VHTAAQQPAAPDLLVRLPCVAKRARTAPRAPRPAPRAPRPAPRAPACPRCATPCCPSQCGPRRRCLLLSPPQADIIMSGAMHIPVTQAGLCMERYRGLLLDGLPDTAPSVIAGPNDSGLRVAIGGAWDGSAAPARVTQQIREEVGGTDACHWAALRRQAACALPGQRSPPLGAQRTAACPSAPDSQQ